MRSRWISICMPLVLILSMTPTALFSGIARAYADTPSSISFSGQYEDNLYKPSTQMVNAPLAIWRVSADEASKVAETLRSNTPPQIVEVSVDVDLQTYSADGSRQTGLDVNSLLQVINEAPNHSIPMFRVEDKNTATKLAEQLNAGNTRDVYVVSDDVDVLSTITPSTDDPDEPNTDGLRGVLDESSQASIPEAGEKLAEIAFAAREAGCYTIMFDAKSMDKERVDYLRDRFMSVFMTVNPSDTLKSDGSGEDKELATTALHTAILAGAQAIGVSDYASIYDALRTYTKESSLARPPVVVGHQGSKTDAGVAGDTLEAYEWAVGKGDRILETDIWDYDGLPVSHNNPKNPSSCLKLKTLLKEYEHTDELIYVEVKWNDDTGMSQSAYAEDIAKKLTELFEEDCPDARDNVVLISLNGDVVKGLSADIPWVPVADVSTSRDSNSEYDLGSTSDDSRCVQLERWGAVADMKYSNFHGSSISDSMRTYAKVMQQRGLMAGYWTADGSWLDTLMTAEASSITTNSSGRSEKYVTKIKAKSKLKKNGYTIIGKVGENSTTLKGFTPSTYVQLYTQYGAKVGESNTSPNVGVVSLDGNLVQDGNTWKFKDSSNMSSLVAITYTQKMANGSSYTVYSDPITLVGVGVDDTLNKVSVTWKNRDGSTLSSESYYVAQDSDGNGALEPNPIYKYANPTTKPDPKGHYSFAGWQSNIDGNTYSGEIPALTYDQHGAKVTYTAQYNVGKHTGSAATCTRDQVCSICGYVMHKKLGHKYSAGICTRCGHVSSKLKVSIKSPKAKKKALQIRWKRKSGASGYRIAIALKSKHGKKYGKYRYKYVSSKKASYIWKKLKRKRTYKVRVQVYKKVHGKKVMGKWSSTKTKKTK